MQGGIVRLCRVTKSVILVTRFSVWAPTQKCFFFRGLCPRNRRLLPPFVGKQVENETSSVF